MRSIMLARVSKLVPIILSLALASCAGSSRPPSVVLITIDTLRADHLGCYGYDRATSPQIDRLAERGVVFTRITASLPRTTQSIASILTGRFPKHHGARGLFSHLAAPNESLTEILKREGFQTAAFVSNMFLRPGQGFEQGFDLFDNPERRWHGNSAPEITESAVRWLGARARDRPFFLWVHYLDPHWTYEPPAPFATRFGRDAPSFTAYQDLDSGRLTKGELIFRNGLSDEQRSRAIALYDGEIAHTDASLEPLLDALAASPEPVLVVLTSDHGESLGEHDYFYAHGEYLYEPGLHIPLIINFPGVVPEGLRTDLLGQNIDVAPTILALTGIRGLQGVDGRPLLVAGAQGGPFRPAPGRPKVFAESDYQLIHPENQRYYIPGPRGRWSSASDGRHKLIHVPRPSGEILELYDLSADPGERNDLLRRGGAGEVEIRDDLLRALRRFVDYEPGLGPRNLDRLDAAELDRLRSLGYIN